MLTRDDTYRDCQLAAAAQLYADHQATNNGCAMVHSTNTERQGFLAQAGYSGHAGATSNTGENLAWTSASQSSSDGGATWIRSSQIKNGREVSGMWASEKEWYHMGASGDSCTIDTTVDGQNGMVGHYTAQIWHATTHVGCGVSQCNDHSVLWVCQYYPAGNYMGQLPFCKSNKPSDMGACPDLSSQSDPVGLTCNPGWCPHLTFLTPFALNLVGLQGLTCALTQDPEAAVQMARSAQLPPV